jgi:MOSC domain-containing protein YiiM
MARVAHLFRAAKRHLPMVEIDQAEAIAAFGFTGCVHGKKNSNRQVLLVDQETLDAMSLQPGIIRENITTQGLNVNGLVIGEQLRIGDVLLQVSAVCTPCDQLELVRPGLRREIYGRRGMLCRVVEGGSLRVGDAIERVVAAASA